MKRIFFIILLTLGFLFASKNNAAAQTFYCSWDGSLEECVVSYATTPCDGMAGWEPDPSQCARYNAEYDDYGCQATANNPISCINTNPPEEPGDNVVWCFKASNSPCYICDPIEEGVGGFSTQEECESARAGDVTRKYSCDNPSEGCVEDPSGTMNYVECFNMCIPDEPDPDDPTANPPDGGGVDDDGENSSGYYCNDGAGINSAIGCIPIDDIVAMAGFLITWSIGIGGGIAFLLMLYAGYMMMTSSGQPRRLQAAKELFVSAMAGLIMLVFSVFIIRIIGFDILRVF